MFTEEQTEDKAPSFEMIDGQLVDTSSTDSSTTEEQDEGEQVDEGSQSTDESEDAQTEQSVDNEAESSDQSTTTETEEEFSDNGTEPDDEDDADFLAELSNDVGIEFKSSEDITQALKDYAQLKNQENPYDSDPELKALREFKEAGGDTSQYYALKSQNFETMDAKSLLKEQWKLENKDLVAKNPSLAEKKFNREMKSNYGLLDVDLDRMDEEEREEWMAEHGEELELQKDEIQYNSDLAKEKLLEWQSKATTPPAKQEPEMSPEEAQQIQEQWESSLSQAAESFDGFDIPLEGVDDFKVGLHPEELNEIKESVKDPGAYISNLFGFENGNVDSQKLLTVAAKLANFDKLGQLMNDYILEQRNLETIEGKQTNPSRPESSHAGKKDLSQRDLWLQAKRVEN